MTTNRPPSCDILKPKLKECPFCGSQAAHHPSLPIIRCKGGCNIYGPDNDPHGHKWNSIPRRSEVKELLRKIDWVSEVNTTDNPSFDIRFMSMLTMADKLRKEWKL